MRLATQPLTLMLMPFSAIAGEPKGESACCHRHVVSPKAKVRDPDYGAPAAGAFVFLLALKAPCSLYSGFQVVSQIDHIHFTTRYGS